MTDAGDSWTFRIDGALTALNEYTAACRTSWATGHKCKQNAQNIVRIYARNYRPPVFDGPVFVTFAWIERNRRRDLDNVAFAKKFILDALVDLGVLARDSRKHVVGFADEFPPPDPVSPRVVVTIERRPA